MANYYNKDLYKILDVEYDASSDEIKMSYRKLVRKYHPDVAKEGDADISKFKEIQEAYEVLTNEESRKKYDIMRGFYQKTIKKETYQYKSNSKTKYNEQIKRAQNRANKPESFSKSINNTLENLFKSSNKKPLKKEIKVPINGENINMDVQISCFEAINGTTRKINIIHTEPCPNCMGHKFINGSTCPMCKGSGQLSLEKKINVKIPKGVGQGSKVRIKKEGNKGLYGGKDGDLYLSINIEKNPYYDIEGMNILCNLPITPFEAVLGADIPIKIFDETITVKIPPLTSSGQKLRLSGLGLDNHSKTKKGDIIITIYIKVPKKITEEEKQLYSDLRSAVSSDIRKDMNNAK